MIIVKDDSFVNSTTHTFMENNAAWVFILAHTTMLWLSHCVVPCRGAGCDEDKMQRPEGGRGEKKTRAKEMLVCKTPNL